MHNENTCPTVCMLWWSNFRFGLTWCRSQNLPSEVRSLLCQVFDNFSLVTSSSSHHASHLRGFIRSLTRPNWSFHSTWLKMSFFLLRQEIFGRYMAIISEWMGKRCWPWDHQWSRTWQKEPPGLAQFDKEHFFGTQGPQFFTARHQSSSAGHAIVWSIVFLFAERNFRLCVNRNFDTIFDPVLPEPNRIFGLLNLSNMCTKKKWSNQESTYPSSWFCSSLPHVVVLFCPSLRTQGRKKTQRQSQKHWMNICYKCDLKNLAFH